MRDDDGVLSWVEEEGPAWGPVTSSYSKGLTGALEVELNCEDDDIARMKLRRLKSCELLGPLLEETFRETEVTIL